MNLSAKQQIGERDKSRFYALAAKRYKAECRMLRLTAMVHLENKHDEVFWGKMLRHACPTGRFRFISASRSVNGNMTAGCTQALKYRPWLGPRLWIAIDSDYRYLTEEPDIDAAHYILQTYTYSFENHFCHAGNLQRTLTETTGCGTETYDFQAFLLAYSQAIYPLLVWLLYLQDAEPAAFPKNVFHRLLSLPIGARSLDHDGASIIHVLRERAQKLRRHFERQYPEADPTWYEARLGALGVRRDNAYLFVRGHQLYDCITEQGRKLVNQTRRKEAATANGKPAPQTASTSVRRDFERQMTAHLSFGAYAEIDRVEADIRTIMQTCQPTPTADGNP